MNGGPEPAAALAAAGVPARLVPPLARYLELLERWKRVHNLVADADLDTLVRRHVLESLAGADHLPEESGLLVDVGSGAGFPGVPLLVARPGWSGLLIEPRSKRWAFLRLVVRELGLAAEVVRARYEEVSLGGRRADAVTSRALGGQEEILEWAAPHLSRRGRVLLWTTEDGVRGLARLGGWRVLSSRLPGLVRGRLAECRPCFT